MEITRLTEQFAADMDHRFNEFVPDFSRLGDTPGKGFVVMANEFHVYTQFNCHVSSFLFRFVKSLGLDKSYPAAMRWLASATRLRTQARLFSIIGPPAPSHSMLTTP